MNRKLNAGLVLLLAVAMFSWVAFPAVRATMFLYEDFENWNVNDWSPFSYGSGTYVETSAVVHGGVKAMNFTTTGTPGSASISQSGTFSTTQAKMIFWLYLPAGLNIEEGAGSEELIAGILDVLPEFDWGIWNNSGVIRPYLYHQTETIYDVYYLRNSSLSLGAWHQVSLSMYENDTGYIELSLDGTVIVHLAGDYWAEGNNDGTPNFYLGLMKWRAMPRWIVIDDIVISDFEGGLVAVSVTADLEGCGNWVFADKKFYDFNATWFNPGNASVLDSAKIRFLNVSTPEGNVNATLSYVVNSSLRTGGWSVEFDPEYETRDLEPIRTQAGNVSYSASWDYIFVVFPVWFTMKCLDVYNQTYAYGVDVWANTTAGVVTGWTTIAPAYFRIYSQGGFSLTEETGLYNAGAGPGLGAGSISGGTPLAVYARNNSYVFKDWIFRDLAHIKLLPEVSVKCGLQTFNIWYGVDVCMGGTDWQHTLALELSANALTYQSPGGSGARNVNMTVRWYKRDSVGDLAYAGGMEDLFMFHRGDAAAVGEITWWRMWVDFWFDGSAGSTKIGGRVNAYEWAMEDNAQPWLKWLSTNWGPDQNATKESQFMTDILGPDNVTVVSSTTIKLVRIWVKVEVVNAATEQMVVLTNYGVTDRTFSQPPLTGIQTPVFDETVVPVMAQAGFLGSVVTFFTFWGRWISDNIMWGGLSLWPAFVAFMDTIAAWLGYPNGFTYLMESLAAGWTYLLSSLGWLFSGLGSIFVFIGSWIGGFVLLFTTALATWANMLSIGISFLYGGAGGLFDFINGLNLVLWIPVVCVFYVVYLVILWDEQGSEAVMAQLGFIYHVGHLFLSWVLTISHFFLDLIGRIIESIPVVE